ncbi:hypothetical protein O7614_20940 [Micromonospora sp. WMMD961]|uniref:hypothetical protein n=1 Tax=Micromonospora sp. WMMD961 TaxID=3016100 RepID=UPI002417C082|nr:hypothetical protein [Micromonospora sp. WMMD961]MDG4782130.1 hypothetical protein [Micromonospora sp. WMMD961]
MTALSSLETALRDISARDLGVPVSRLLGGVSADRVRATPQIGAAPGIELDVTAIERHPSTPHPLRMVEDVVYDIRPRDERSLATLESGS